MVLVLRERDLVHTDTFICVVTTNASRTVRIAQSSVATVRHPMRYVKLQNACGTSIKPKIFRIFLLCSKFVYQSNLLLYPIRICRYHWKRARGHGRSTHITRQCDDFHSKCSWNHQTNQTNTKVRAYFGEIVHWAWTRCVCVGLFLLSFAPWRRTHFIHTAMLRICNDAQPTRGAPLPHFIGWLLQIQQYDCFFFFFGIISASLSN